MKRRAPPGSGASIGIPTRPTRPPCCSTTRSPSTPASSSTASCCEAHEPGAPVRGPQCRHRPTTMNVAFETPDQPEVARLIDELDAYQKPLYPPESHHGIDMAA